MACDAEDCRFQMLNDDEIVISIQEESDPANNETSENEDNTTKVTGMLCWKLFNCFVSSDCQTAVIPNLLGLLMQCYDAIGCVTDYQ
ncbi:hypothetical protein TNCV_4795221 [Trichonephila clavipes]|nr:hypothetical protein TNCV_4795221 [Trichonephila clavipes]